MIALQCEPSIRVVQAVAERKGVDPLSLSPLQRTIDCDSLDRLFARTPSGLVTFEYEGYRVHVDGTGAVEVEEAVTVESPARGDARETVE